MSVLYSSSLELDRVEFAQEFPAPYQSLFLLVMWFRWEIKEIKFLYNPLEVGRYLWFSSGLFITHLLMMTSWDGSQGKAHLILRPSGFLHILSIFPQFLLQVGQPVAWQLPHCSTCKFYPMETVTPTALLFPSSSPQIILFSFLLCWDGLLKQAFLLPSDISKEMKKWDSSMSFSKYSHALGKVSFLEWGGACSVKC